MDLWRSLGGMIQVRITSANMELLLMKLNQNGITLYNLQLQDELTCFIIVKREDYKHVTRLCTQMGAMIQINNQKGLYWIVEQLLRRPILVTGFFVLLMLVSLLPTRVLFLRVEGNETVPSRKILEAAERCGICFGASRREVRSEKVKNALIGAVPELQWAGVNTKGCVATISVRERIIVPQDNPVPVTSNIVAAQDGYVLSATATQGTLLVQPGQSVTAGQTLISGVNDLGILVRTTAAAGEVYAQTQRQISIISPLQWCHQQKTLCLMKKVSLVIGKKRIILWKDSGIPGATCGRMYKEMYVTLPGNFSLPLALCVETYEVYEQAEKTSEEITDNIEMMAYAENYLLRQMIAGQILKSDHHWINENGVFLLQAKYVCREMIGRQRQEQIGDIHE